jgi:predicted ATPase/class 3 adenylate cyclase
MRCPNCQTINPPNAKFCLECGTRLVICPNCDTVNPPQAKFCIECGTTLAGKARMPSSPNSFDESLTLLSANGQRTEKRDAPTLEPEQHPIRLPVIQVSPEERRVVTIMFADITGSTPLADRLDPEDMRAILTGYFNLMAEQIRKHGGTVEKYIGDAVMAVFGLPSAHEDDPDRAIRAALDMQAALERFNTQRQTYTPDATKLQMRMGINTGEVAAPTNASPQGQDFLVTGDAVNVAARLQQLAAPDTILVGERTYYSARGVFAFRPLAPLNVKGKAEPICAYVVQRSQQDYQQISIQQPRGVEGRESPLVGRTLELTLLHASYARVLAERRPHLITILGTPGVGKSRLVREFIAREQERVKSISALGTPVAPLVLKGRCLPYGESITYWPLVEILRTLLKVQDDEDNTSLQHRFTELVAKLFTQTGRNENPGEIAAAILRRIGPYLSKQTGDTQTENYEGQLMAERETPTRKGDLKQRGEHGAHLRAWRILVEALAEQQPLVIIVDDLQWADEALLELLEYLTERIASAPVLFLTPARPDFFEHRRDWGGGHRNITTIELEALSWDESSELVNELLNNDELPEMLRYTILTRAEGNPFFVEEIIRMLIDQDILVPEVDPTCDKDCCWRVSYRHDGLLGKLTTPGDLPEDPPLDRQHLLTLPYLLTLPHLPDTVQGVLAARIDLLHPTEKLVLQYAAIIGRTLWLSALLELAEGLDRETVLDALVSLQRRDFIVETEKQLSQLAENDRTFHFKHILIRDVVYGTIPRQRRSREHAHLALWLESKAEQQPGTFLELLANHYQQALAIWSYGSGIETLDIQSAHDGTTTSLTRTELRRRTVHYLTAAGDQAMHSYYSFRALRAYNDALELLIENQADAMALSKMHKKLGDAYTQRTNLDEAWQHYRTALQLVTGKGNDDPAEIVPENESDRHYLLVLYEHLSLLVLRWLGNFDSPPDIQEARQYIDAGLRLSEGALNSRERTVFHIYEAFWYIHQLTNAPAEQKIALVEMSLASGMHALELSENLNDPHTLSLTLDAIGFAYMHYHRYDKALEIQLRRQQLEPQLTDRDELYDIYHSQGCVAQQVGDYPRALACYGKAWSTALTMESPTLLRANMTRRMHIWLYWNRWDEAKLAAQEVLQLIEKYQLDERHQLWPLETLARIAYHRGNLEEGDRYAKSCKRLLDMQMERAQRNVKKETVLRMRLIHSACGALERALAEYQELVASTEPLPEPEALAMLADLLVQTRKDLAQQMEVCQRAVELSKQSGARKSLAVALRARGGMYTQRRDWEQAEHDLRQGLQLCEEIDLPWEQGHTRQALGTLYLQRADEANNEALRNADLGRARYHFEQALGFYESLHAAPMAQQVRERLADLKREHGEREMRLVNSSGD